MSSRKQAVIISGGQGKRLRENGIMTPKLLLNIDKACLLDYLILELEREEFTDVLFLLGHQSDLILARLNKIDTSLKISVKVEQNPSGTLGALKQAHDLLENSFVVIFGDLFLHGTNLGGLFRIFLESKFDLIALVKQTDHPQDSDLVEIDKNQKIVKIHKYPHPDSADMPNTSLAGIFFLDKNILSEWGSHLKGDISKDFIPALAQTGRAGIYFHQGTIRDLGTVERLNNFKYESIKYEQMFSSKKLILLDRDGILNIDKGPGGADQDIEITSFSGRLLEVIRSLSLDFAIVTNQPSVAHGLLTLEESVLKTKNILRIASNQDSDDFTQVFTCPHHPTRGFHGEVTALKIKCGCRKPLPGLLLAALERFNARASNAIMIGDSATDIEAAMNIGAIGIHLHTEKNSAEIVCDFQNRTWCASEENVEFILREAART